MKILRQKKYAGSHSNERLPFIDYSMLNHAVSVIVDDHPLIAFIA